MGFHKHEFWSVQEAWDKWAAKVIDRGLICLPTDSLVSTNPIPSFIQSASGKEIEGGLITERFHRLYSGKVLEINLRGYRVCLTPEHPLKVARIKRCKWGVRWCKPNCGMKKYGCSTTPEVIEKFVEAKNLLSSDYLMIPRYREIESKPLIFKRTRFSRKRIPEVVPLTKELFEILGWYLAEGNCYESGAIVFSLGLEEVEESERLKELLERVFRIPAFILLTETSRRISINCTELLQLFKQFGKRANEKVIPEFVMKAPFELQETFLRAYWQGDKTGSNTSIGVITSSKKLLYQLILLAARLGLEWTADEREQMPSKLVREAGMRYCLFFYGKRTKEIFPEYPYKSHKSKSWFSEEYYYTPITSLRSKEFSGFVHNLETENNTYSVPFVVHNCQKKFDGMRFQIHVKGNRVKIITEDRQRDRASLFPKCIKELLAKKKVDNFVLDAEMVEYNCRGKKVKDKEEICEQYKREQMIPWVTVTKKKLDDENIVFHIHDCVFLKGEDIHEKGYVERWEAIGKCFPEGLEHWRKVKSTEANTVREFFKAVKKERTRPGSEGAVIKIKDSIYKLTGRTSEWCLTGGSWVLTENGLEQIAFLKPGTKVFSKDGKLHKILRKSKRLLTTAEDLYEIGDRHGIKVRATNWHQIYLNPGEWKPVEEANSVPSIPRLEIPFEKAPEELTLNWHGYKKRISCDKDFWKAIGFWIAEGSLGNNRNRKYKRGEVEFSQKNPEIFNHYAEIFDQKLRVKGKRYYYKINHYHVWDKPFCDWLSEHFLDKNSDKTLPWFIATLAKEDLEAFIQGWKEGDACKERGRISTSDRGLAGRIYAILNSLNKEVSLTYQKRKGHKDSFLLQILKQPRHQIMKRKIYTDHKDTVYDLEIENEDSFMTANLVFHNCKIKNLKEIDVMVWDIVQKKTKAGVKLAQWIYYPVFLIPCKMKSQIKENQVVEWKGKCYAKIGRAYGTKVKAVRGDIITVRPVQIIENKDEKTGKIWFSWMFPYFEGKKPEKKEPDTITTVRRIVKVGTAPLPEQLAESMIIRLPECPYWNDASICPLRERFYVPPEALSKQTVLEEYLKFPINCRFANRFKCRFVKSYYYSLRPKKEYKEEEVEYMEED